MRRTSFLCLLLCVASATLVVDASAARPPQRVEPGTVKTVGIVNTLEPTVMHSHVGKTVFGTFEHKLDNTWDIPGFIERTLTEQLAAQGIVTKRIELPSEQQQVIAKGCYSWAGRFRAECRTVLDDVRKRYEVDAVVTLETFRSKESGFSESGWVGGYGVFTLGLNNPKDATVHANIHLNVYTGDPPRVLDAAFCHKFKTIEKDFGKPVKEVTIADIEWARPSLEGLLQGSIVNTLKAGGLIAGDPETCEYE